VRRKGNPRANTEKKREAICASVWCLGDRGESLVLYRKLGKEQRRSKARKQQKEDEERWEERGGRFNSVVRIADHTNLQETAHHED